MGVDAYLKADSDPRYCFVGRARHLELIFFGRGLSKHINTLDALRSSAGAVAEKVEAFALAQMHRLQMRQDSGDDQDEIDEWMARKIILFSRACAKQHIRLICDIDDDMPKDDFAEFWPTDAERHAIDGTCPTCGLRPHIKPDA